MKRIERDPEPWEYSEANFMHVAESIRRAEAQEHHDDAPGVNWSALSVIVLDVMLVALAVCAGIVIYRLF